MGRRTHDAARQASKDAKKYAIWGLIAGGVATVLYFLFFFIIGIGAAAASDGGY